MIQTNYEHGAVIAIPSAPEQTDTVSSTSKSTCHKISKHSLQILGGFMGVFGVLSAGGGAALISRVTYDRTNNGLTSLGIVMVIAGIVIFLSGVASCIKGTKQKSSAQQVQDELPLPTLTSNPAPEAPGYVFLGLNPLTGQTEYYLTNQTFHPQMTFNAPYAYMPVTQTYPQYY